MIGLDDLDDELHDGGGREELAALLHVVRGELAHEVFEDEPVGVALDLQRREEAQQFLQHGVRQPGVALRQHAGEVGVGLGDALHGGVQLGPRFAVPGSASSREKRAFSGRKIAPSGLIVGRSRLQPTGVLRRQLGVDRLELGLHRGPLITPRRGGAG